jgi:DNA-binding transcriptional regulator YdaS (Cro superfamily)
VHPIRRYCRDRAISERAFAETCGLSSAYISQICTGKAKPGREAALTIVMKTGGAIRIEDLLTWSPREMTQ